ncbi:MAG: c-type cytochrome [Planctomycetes bacterium]|nr:c-type cytochrome [Planctomycetota bacterium]
MKERPLSPAGLIHKLWVMNSVDTITPQLLLVTLWQDSPEVRETGLRLAETHCGNSEVLRNAILRLVNDRHPQVRFQAALSLGAIPADEAGPGLVKLLERDDADIWLQTAVLSSATNAAPAMLEAILVSTKLPPEKANPLILRLAAMIGAQGKDEAIARVLKLLGKKSADAGLPATLLEGLGQGMQNSTRPLSKLWDAPPAALKEAVELALATFRSSAEIAKNDKQSLPNRLAALRLLAHAPAKLSVEALSELLVPQQPLELQSAAVRTLSLRNEAEIAPMLLTAWTQAGPSLRGDLLEAIFARPDRIAKLLDALESKKVAAAQIETARIQFLKSHPNLTLRKRATTLLAGLGDSDRKKIVDSFKDALDLKPDLIRGKMLFAKNCAVCHRLENVGQEVGANLMAALRTKTKEALLIDILDPSREVDTRYVTYRATTLNGQTFTGILAVETPSSITLRRAEKAEDTILRNQIDEIVATTKSLMPEEFEKQLMKQDVADLIAYLMSMVK